MTPLSVKQFRELSQDTDVIVMDTRHQQIFKDGFVPGSLFFGLKGSFAPWVANVLKDVQTKIIFVADEGTEKEVVTRLSRVGFDNILGFLNGGVAAWEAEGESINTIESVNVEDLYNRMQTDELQLIDVRKPSEQEAGSVEHTENYPLDYIDENIKSLDKSKQYHIHCRSGYRSMVYASMMLKMGFKNPVDIAGGFNAIKESGQFTLLERASCSLS